MLSDSDFFESEESTVFLISSDDDFGFFNVNLPSWSSRLTSISTVVGFDLSDFNSGLHFLLPLFSISLRTSFFLFLSSLISSSCFFDSSMASLASFFALSASSLAFLARSFAFSAISLACLASVADFSALLLSETALSVCSFSFSFDDLAVYFPLLFTWMSGISSLGTSESSASFFSFF